MKQLTIILFSIMVLLSAEVVYASWPYLSFDELVKESDTILIGELEEYIESDSPGPVWQVDVNYYFKSDVNLDKVVVSMPDVYLDSGVKDVLLFLHNSEGRYVTVTPNGVIPLHRNVGDFQSDGSVTGRSILKQFNVDKEAVSAERKLEIVSYIEQSKVHIPDADARAWGFSLVVFLACLVLVILVFTARKLVSPKILNK